MLNFESAKRIGQLMDWDESRSIFNYHWGDGEELKLSPQTYYASSMNVYAFCGKMDFVPIYIPVARYSPSNDHYATICRIIHCELNLDELDVPVHLMDFGDVMMLVIGVNWRLVPKANLESMVEKLADSVRKFRNRLDDYGYC